MLRFKQYFLFNEGVHDPGIFHAVFMAGGPGSGKDYVMSRTLHGHGLREINSDIAFEHAMKKHGLSMLMPKEEEEKRDVLRSGAKETTQKMQNLSQEGRNGLIINGTGANPEKYAKIKDHLESLGYKTHMVFVHTKNSISHKRNIERGLRGGREVDEDIRQQSWNDVQNAKEHYKKIFGDNYHEVDNNIDKRYASKEMKDKHDARLNQVFKHFRKQTGSKQYSPQAKEWIQTQQRLKRQQNE